MSSKLRLYELTTLFNVYVSDDSSKNILNSCFDGIPSTSCKILSIIDKGRFEIQHKKVIMKINLFCCQFEAEASVISQIKKNIKDKQEILKHLVVLTKENKVGGFLDYKKPIDMKKYIFESLRIMPNELTGFSKKVQKALSKNIKRARILGLVGRFNK